MFKNPYLLTYILVITYTRAIKHNKSIQTKTLYNTATRTAHLSLLLFTLILRNSHVPDGFRYSYIVPIPKIKDCRTRAMTCNDFRGIAISPVVSKIFEHCLLDKFQCYLNSCDIQFGFKKGSGCRNAIYSVHRIVEHFTKGGSTVNICAIDLHKA